jgi:glucose/arabinose dehydrogenase
MATTMTGRSGMKRRWARIAVVAAGLLTACGDGLARGADPWLETVASGLVLPWDLEFTPDGRMLVTEKPGRIRVIEAGRLRDEPWATLDVFQRAAAGLMGIALDPRFAENGFVYVVATFRTEDTLVNRVIRLTDRGGYGVEPTMLVDGMPSGITHAGAQLAFGPDGMMYVTSGELNNPPMAQDMATTGSKLLRYRPDGTIPDDNPFPGSPIYVLGMRNPQGLAWHPETGDLFATEHGPTGFDYENFWRDEDEINAVIAGENYGWPLVSGLTSGLVDDPRFVPPLVEFTPAIAPSGLAFYTGPHERWRNSLFAGCLRGQQLRRLALEPDPGARTGWRIARQEIYLEQQLGRIRAVVMGPDGYLYITTNNRTGRGEPPNPDDDRLLRVVPSDASGEP